MFGASALALGAMFWRGGHWVRCITMLLIGVWLYQAQWYGRALWDVRWIDDTRSLHQQDAVLAAIRDGQTHIPLMDTTNFTWTAVCYLSANHSYAVPEGQPLTHASEVMRNALGTDDIPYFEDSWSWREYSVLVYATPDGPYVMEPEWTGRLSREFQSRWMGRYYADKLKGNGYWLSVKTVEEKDGAWGGLCFRPRDVWLEVSPEPPWTDNIPALVEQMKTK